MRKFLLFIILTGFFAVANSLSISTHASEVQVVTLDVKNMTCAMCPITVRKALEQVPGVIKAEAKYEGESMGWAKVTFNPDKTTIETLTNATSQAGYPSILKTEQRKE